MGGLDGLNNNLGMAGLNGVKGLGGLSGLGGIRGVSGDLGLGAGKIGVDQSDNLLGQQRLGGRFGVNYGGNVGYSAGTVGYAPQQQGVDIGLGLGSYYNSGTTVGVTNSRW